MRSVILAVFLLGITAAAQEAPQYGKWIRQVNTDQLTGKTQMMYEFLQQQPDGRIPSISFYCSNGKMDGMPQYFTGGVNVFYDANADMFAVGAGAPLDLNKFVLNLQFRGAGKKVYSAAEWVQDANPQFINLTAGEGWTLIDDGTLVMRYRSADGYDITDTFQQSPWSIGEEEQYQKDCDVKVWIRNRRQQELRRCEVDSEASQPAQKPRRQDLGLS